MLTKLQIPSDVWRKNLINYEDHQIRLIQETGEVDQLKNINYSSRSQEKPCAQLNNINKFGEGVPVWNEEKGKTEYQKFDPIHSFAHLHKNNKLIECIFDTRKTTEAEKLFHILYKNIFNYIVSKRDSSLIFAIWEPSCECGNGFFSIALQIEPKNSALNFISEFAYKVCKMTHGKKLIDISTCDGHHQLGNGQKVYLAGDYRYQVLSSSGITGQLRAIKLREKDAYSPKIIFTESGHTILE